jgi:two-component system, NarL family, response regulator DevR
VIGVSEVVADDDISVFLLDDHEIVRRGIRHLLGAAGIEVVGESSTAAEAGRRIPALRPTSRYSTAGSPMAPG